MRQIKNYGWIPDLPDHRDYVYAAPSRRIGVLPISGLCDWWSRSRTPCGEQEEGLPRWLMLFSDSSTPCVAASQSREPYFAANPPPAAGGSNMRETVCP